MPLLSAVYSRLLRFALFNSQALCLKRLQVSLTSSTVSTTPWTTLPGQNMRSVFVRLSLAHYSVHKANQWSPT
jgi:hypothetical protein